MGSGLAHALTEAGVDIKNQAVLSYQDEQSGTEVQIASNTSVVTVSRVRRFIFYASGDTDALTGERVHFPHRLGNQGNADDRYRVAIANHDSQLLEPRLVFDLNANGVADDDEPDVVGILDIEPSQSVNLVFTAVVAPGVSPDELLVATLEASTEDDLDDTREVVDTVRVLEPSQPSLAITIDAQCEVPLTSSDTPELSILLGLPDSSIQTREIIVDGQPVVGLLAQVPLPEGVVAVDHAHASASAVLPSSDGGWERVSSVESVERLVWFVDPESLLLPASLLLTASLDLTAQVSGTWLPTASIDLDGDALDDVAAFADCEHVLTVEVAEPPDNESDEGEPTDETPEEETGEEAEEEQPEEPVEPEIQPQFIAQEPELRFLMPAVELQQQGVAPHHELDADFVDTEVYPVLFRPEYDDVVRDAVYIEYSGVTDSASARDGPDGLRYQPVELGSVEGNQFTTVWLRETAPDSGVFRSVVPIVLTLNTSGDTACPQTAEQAFAVSANPVLAENACFIASGFEDQLVVQLPSGEVVDGPMDFAVTDEVSHVFVGESGFPVAGALVQILNAGQVVEHPLTGEPLIQSSDNSGRYVIPRLPEELEYTVDVDPGEDYVFPSNWRPDGSTDYNVVQASYGASGPAGENDGRFSREAGEPAPVVDIPVDVLVLAPATTFSLQLDKTVEQDIVEIGETVGYRITVSNDGEEPLDDVTIVDTPPPGFAYIGGSTRLDGQRLPDPDEGNAGGVTTLDFEIGDLDAGKSTTLSYVLQPGASVSSSQAVNTAVATAVATNDVVVATAPSSASVRLLRTGAFGDHGMVFGKVYVDASCNGIHDESEWPIAGVRLYMENGRFVITDENGLFSLTQVTPGQHVLKLDASTLPEGLIAKPLSVENAADADSRFVRVHEGEWHRADFATFCPADQAESVLAELKRRHESLAEDWVLDRASQLDPDGRSSAVAASQQAGADGDLGQGWVGDAAARNRAEATQPGDDGSSEDDVSDSNADAGTDDSGVDAIGMADPELLARTITREQAKEGVFLWPEDGVSDDGRFMVVVRAGVVPTLFIGDREIPDAQIGERIESPDRSAQIVAWYGVDLSAGSHQVQVRGRDPFGNERVLAEKTVRRAARASKLVMRAPTDQLLADGGQSRLPIEVLLTDAAGTPASGVRFVTLDTTRGSFSGEDLQRQEPGHQIRLERGRARVELISSERAGRVRVDARSGGLRTRLELVQLTAPRPLIASGVLQAGVTRRTHADGASVSDLETDSRSAFFVRGGIRWGADLTLAWDSDKSSDTSLLEGLPGDSDWASLGDASIQGYEAQSRSRLYARLERDRHSLMWGDYLTDVQSDLDDLARTQRTLTGLNGVFDTGVTRLQAFAAEQSDTRQVEQLNGNGTALLYRLQGAPIVANSQIVERLVFDGDNTGLVLSVEQLVAGIDYQLDAETGMLRFAEVVPTVDEQGNTVVIRVSYDTSGDGDEHWIAGLRISRNVGENAYVGASFTNDDHPLTGYRIAGAQARYVLGDDSTSVSVSGAFMQHRDGREGQAARIGVSHEWSEKPGRVTRFTWAEAGQNFDNAGSGIAAGRREWRLDHRHPLSNKSRLLIDALESATTDGSSRYRSAGFRVDHDTGRWTLGVGARHVKSDTGLDVAQFNTVLLAADRSFALPGERSGRIGVEYEHALDDADRRRLSVEGRLGLRENVDAYLRVESERGLSASGVAGTSVDGESLVAGIESDWIPGAELFSEYRLKGAFGGRTAEAVSGVRARHVIEPGLTLSPSLEIIRVLDDDIGDSLALSLAIGDTRNEHRRLSARLELRRSDTDDYIGVRATAAQRLTRDWTFVASESFSRQFPATGEHTIRQRLRLGLARRPKHDNRHHGLLSLEWRHDRTPEFDGDTDRIIAKTLQHRELTPTARWSARAAAKWTRLDLDDHTTWQHATLTGSRLTLDLARRWQLDVGGGLLTTGQDGDVLAADESAWSAGLGLSWIAMKNLVVQARWNALGFEEPDLDATGIYEAGFRLGLDYKFDEDVLQWLSDY